MKYHNKPYQIGDEKYRSQREGGRHQELVLLQRAGQITGLVREVPFVLAQSVKFDGDKRAKPALRYYADFVYSDVATGRVVVEDAKGIRTALYRAKRHLMATVHGIQVREV